MRSFLLLPVTLLAGGCIEYNTSRIHGIDTFEQYSAEKIDILMVVDNSSSMGPYQTQLGGNFEAFISRFLNGDVDYHIGITTTDDGNDSDVANPARGRFVGPMITSDMDLATADGLFRSQVAVGTEGTGLEVGLKTAHLALTDEANLGDQIAEFLRDEATLSIVFVSDEEDSSPWPVNDYVNAFFAVKGQRDRDVFNASALTVTDETACTAEGAGFSSPGRRYIDVAAQTHGLSANLCETDFTQIVTDLSLANSRLQQTFELSSDPDARTLEVTIVIDGVDTIVPCDAGEWSYQRVVVDIRERPAIVFDIDHLPPPGSTVEIRYLLGNGNVDSFCEGGS